MKKNRLHMIRFDQKFKILLLFIAFMFGLSTVIILYMSNQYNKTIIQNIDRSNKMMMESIEYYFDDVKTPMVMIAQNSTIQKAMKDYNNLTAGEQLDVLNGMKDFVQNITTFKPFINDIFIIGNDGYVYNIYNSTSEKFLGDFDFLNSDYLSQAREGNIRLYYLGKHETDYYLHPIQESSVYSVAFPVKQGMKRIGYVMCDIKASVINEVIEYSNSGRNAKIAILDENGDLVYEQGYGRNDEICKLEELQEKGKTLPEHNLFKILFSKEDYITFEKSDVTGWTYVHAEPYSSFNGFVKQVVIMGAVVILIGMGVIAVFLKQLTGEIIVPLKNIAFIIHEMKINQGEDSTPFYRAHGESVAELSVEIENMIRKIDTLVNDVYISELKAKDAQIQIMTNQLSPHFLYNTLQLIEYQSYKKDNENVTRIIEGLSYILRYSIESASSMAEVKREIAYTDHYLTIYRLRYEEKLNYKIEVEQNVESCIVPKMILQPLVENSIKHGFSGKFVNAEIRVRVYGKDNVLFFEVWDNGKGMTQNQVSGLNEEFRYPKVRGEHIGLNNINSIIKIRYGASYGVTVDSREGAYTRVVVRVPVKKEGKGENFEKM